ncbi:Tyrosine-protein kinase, partial [Parasponia andersonii]
YCKIKRWSPLRSPKLLTKVRFSKSLIRLLIGTRNFLLVYYEFIANGTHSDHIHDKDQYSFLLWKMHLKIATETAGVIIAYFHSSTLMPIIHRDSKTTNILLDESYTTKVSDFGASRLVPLDQTQLNTLVQGTLVYLDPKYFQTSQLIEKSDVYSFE